MTQDSLSWETYQQLKMTNPEDPSVVALERFLTHFWGTLDSLEVIATLLSPLGAGRLITDHPRWMSCTPAKEILEEKLLLLTHLSSLLSAVSQHPSLLAKLSGTGEDQSLMGSDRLCIVKSL